MEQSGRHSEKNQRTVDIKGSEFSGGKWKMNNKSQNLIQDVASFRIINLICMRQEEEKCLFLFSAPIFIPRCSDIFFKLPSSYFSFTFTQSPFFSFYFFLNFIFYKKKHKVSNVHLHNNLL